MVIYYDMLMLDGQSLLGVRHSDRFKLLQKTIHCHAGGSEIVNRTLVDFHHPEAASELRKAFSQVIVGKGEGLVLKPDEPYFDFLGNGTGCQSGFCVKLKKEYIGNFGDVGDFAVVGAGFNAAKAKSYGLANIKWTVFYIGCLENKEQVRRWSAAPKFTVVTAVELSEVQLKALMAHGAAMPVDLSSNTSTLLNIPRNIEASAPLTVAFQNPLVFDLRCFSFDKPGNLGFWTLRFPVVAKIHFDRDYIDTVSFSELQTLAKDARSTPDLEDSQENLRWIAKLEGADPRGVAVDAASQLTATTIATPSPVSSRPRVPSSSSRSIAQSPTCTRPGGINPSPTPPKVQANPPIDTVHSVRQPIMEKRKRKALNSEQLPYRSQRQKSSSTQPRRKPLGDVDGNASQQSQTTTDSSELQPQDAKEHHRVYPSISLITAPKGDKSPRRMALTLSSGPVATLSQQLDRCPMKVTKEDSDSRNGLCLYSGSDCRLSGYKVYVAPKILEISRQRHDLLQHHGILDPMVICDDWQPVFRTEDSSPALKYILLVDSVARVNEAAKLLTRIKSSPRMSPSSTRQWIEVYDWRVLETIRDVEDGKASSVKSSGFRDPCRRWFCGII